MNRVFEERPTEGMPDMMPKGTVDNPPQKEPQNIPLRMEEQPYESPHNENKKDNDIIEDITDERRDERNLTGETPNAAANKKQKS